MKKTDINKKREKEKQMVSYMIALYCKKNHHNKYNKGSIIKNTQAAPSVVPNKGINTPYTASILIFNIHFPFLAFSSHALLKQCDE